ncbi:MAG: YidC/Oxa1 family membrane protein insertase [Anaerolineae bacterium]
MFDAVLIRPVINLLLLLYKFLGQETIVAVALVTLILRLALTPLQLKQQRSAKRQQELQPKLEELQKKYKDDREKLAQEQMKLYQEAGVNPVGGCLTLLIQLPLMIGLYQAIIRVLASTPLQLLALPADIYRWIPSLSTLIPLKSRFLWLDLALPDPYYVLPILVVITAWYYQKLLTPPARDAQSEAMSKQMQIMMPLMTGFFAATYASGLGIYFLISNLVGILQYFLFRAEYAGGKTEEAPQTQKAARKGSKRATSRG